MIYSVRFTPSALSDLVKAKNFYAQVDSNLGRYCVDSLTLDAERLAFFAGIHPLKFGYYRMLARNFPFSIYYTIHNQHVLVNAFIDNRRQPQEILKKLTKL
jgi:hypothetical protein